MFEDADEATLKEISGWKNLPAKHQPQYPDSDFLGTTVDYLRTMPPLIFAGEADSLKEEFAKASRGEAFVLQGGDCAESFADATADRIRAKIRTILQMAVVLTYSGSVPRGHRAAVLHGRRRQRARIHRVHARARSAPPRRGLPALGRHAESHPRLHRRRIRGYCEGARVEQGLLVEPCLPPLQPARLGNRSRHAVHEGRRRLLRIAADG